MPESRPPLPAARRRAVALAGHLGDEATARAFLHDEDPRVRATAVGALARLGALGDDDVRAMAVDPDPSVRGRIARVVPSALDADAACAVLRTLLHDGEASVVEVAAWALGEVDSPASDVVHELAEVATAHADPLARESAVAALGAIGDFAGLDAILAATSDKPAVRRRAVLALAPFDGPEVDTALRRALEDRDWQVRQAAEDLLD
ncbi:MAG TPA: HEAT repeat domain-containing protein [Acidimicrobiales bacterium]|jgi:HEAT repeat protein|nr:HEAT repeat domain-containing protein [Acidimicrobiales bacterium]